MAVIASLAALVLGLLVASAKSSFDAQAETVRQLSSEALVLDRMLALYGPETASSRAAIRLAGEQMLAAIWPERADQGGALTPGAGMQRMSGVYEVIAGLQPQNEAQSFAKSSALQALGSMAETRYGLLVHDTSVPTPLLVVLTVWLVVLFTGYAFLAPRNATTMAVLLGCALCLSGAVFLILELFDPFGGLVRVSSHPLQEALALIGQ
jgi:hypothetical protein